jgi:hypothetical protein
MAVMLARPTENIGVQNVPDYAPMDQHGASADTGRDTAE